VQEVKWTGCKEVGIGEGYKVFYNGGRLKENGVGVAISERLCDSVVEVHRVSDRLISVKIESGPTTLRIVSCYAPQQGCTDEAKDAFWTSMDDHMRSFGAEEHVFIGGDLNGHVGHERLRYEKYHGGQGLGARNDEGYRILDFAEPYELALGNTFFKKRLNHLITYCSGPRSSQVDYLLVRRSDLRRVKNAKVIPSDTVAPQHRLLLLDICMDVGQRRPVRTTGAKEIKWWLVDKSKARLEAALNNMVVDLDQPAPVLYEQVTNQIRTHARAVLGVTKPGRKFIDKQVWWWNEQAQAVVHVKKKAFRKWADSKNNDDYKIY